MVGAILRIRWDKDCPTPSVRSNYSFSIFPSAFSFYPMTVQAFVKGEVTWRSPNAARRLQYFLDLSVPAGQPAPAEADPSGEFALEREFLISEAR
jgi:hypothetical protein